MKEPSPAAADDVNARIARRVREFRTLRAETLESLAARCGVSRSMISLIERAEASPTAAVLEKLAAGLGVSMASLFGPEEAQQAPHPLARRSDQAIWKDPESGYLRRNLSPPRWPSPLQLVEVHFPAGARVVLLAGGLGAFSGAAGTVASHLLSVGVTVPTGPTIVLCATLVVLVSLLFGTARGVVWALRKPTRRGGWASPEAP